MHYQDTRTQNVVIQAVSIFSVKQIDGNLPQKSILIVNQGQQTPCKKHYKSLKEVDRNAITEGLVTSCSGHWWRHNGHRQQHQQSKLDYATLSKIRNECTKYIFQQGLSGHIHIGIKGTGLFQTKLCNQVPSLSLSRWRTLTLLKM